MSGKYSLPRAVSGKRSVGPSPLFMGALVVWGLPFLGWVALIVIWLSVSSSDPKPETETKTAQTVEETQAVNDAPAAGTEESSGATSQTEPVEGAPSDVAEQPASSATPGVIAAAPYNFQGAKSQLGLKMENACNTGILVDPSTRKVLWAKGADRAVPIASMTKMMTLLLVEEAIAEGKIKRDTVIPVTEAAYRIGGSQVWLDPRESFPLNELLKAIAIKSANDAAFLVGEYLGEGDIDVFVARMNARARELNMTHTSFYDAHGLGDKQKRSNLASAHDMVLLAERLLNYKEVVKLASTRMDTFRNGKMELKNHNDLVFQRVEGVDGLKTGYTDASGYCVTFTCVRGGRRLIGCVTGFRRSKDRNTFCRALLDWGYSQPRE